MAFERSRSKAEVIMPASPKPIEPNPRPIDAGVGIGHVHLKVADLNRAIAFYCGVLGFVFMQRYGHKGAFLAAGGYHHHLGKQRRLAAGTTHHRAQPYGMLVAVACLIIAFVLAVRAWWKRWTTEIFVTDRRVIFVHGFFDRQSIEVHMNQIESVDVDQTLLGRLFGYGDVTIHGTGNTYDLRRSPDCSTQ